MWRRRDRADLEVPSVITKHAVLQWCGRPTGHVPVCGWLRPACSMFKRIASFDDEDNAIDWDEEVSVRVAWYCRELEARIKKDGGDPARGRWQVSMRDDTCMQVWCDASSIALGVCIEIDGDIVKDKAWLRPADDNRHINDPLPGSFLRMKSQLVVDECLLCRSAKLPVDGEVVVPVIPATLEQQALCGVHETAGHCTSSSMHDLLPAECYFPGMAKACCECVDTCARCRAACPGRAASVPPTRAAVSGRPWNEVVLDTLELGVDRTGRCHCVLVVVDTFTKWAEGMPLRQHTARCVAEAFTTLCMRWGPPQVVRTDNGTEFQNAVVRSLFQFFGVVVKTGAVRHPQSQGSAERFNRTLLGLIRKVLDDSHTWKEDLEMLLRSNRTRPHSATAISPMEAMVGWKPDIIVQKEDACEFSAWCSQLKERSARIRDLVESELSSGDFVNQPMECQYGIGDDVLLARPDRHQKCLTPFESRWTVKKVVAPSTNVIKPIEGGEKVVNVSLIKRDPVIRLQQPLEQKSRGQLVMAMSTWRSLWPLMEMCKSHLVLVTTCGQGLDLLHQRDYRFDA